ncbi:pentatricopeptide repeat-containing protein At1g08070, chloroplastic-like [Quercus robur]|uniref:pentatricopeptide repeat-containing protein At1g08070, chloroplastic-like n=1 Tax=Quercus robur TaxID=38942 RepID=UPI0021636AFA|nr:pentatricopeptide repeat-containing protein At1g08070, chloroplastic-like [Quercus robur]
MAQSASPPHSNANNLHFPHTLFSQIQNPNIFAWNFMFKAYSHSNSNTTASPQQCISLYNLMCRRFGLFLDCHSFPFLFKACACLSLSHKGQELHSLTLILGLQHDVFVQNALLSMYSFCGLLHNARQVFDKILLSVRDVVSWNSMVSGCIQGRCYWDALKVFDEMLKCDVNARLDEVTLINALTACARIGFLNMGCKIHGLLV